MLQLEFWISELAAKTGVSVRTIRYYIEEGLLPQPEIRGKYAVFNEAYLDRLELIKRLKDSYLPLKEIRTLLNTMTEEEIVNYLREFKQDPARTLSSLNSIRERNIDRMEIRDNAEEYIDRILQNPKRAAAVQKQNFQMDMPPIRAMEIPSEPAQPVRESWQRIELSDGIELHVREPLNSSRRRLVNRLVELIQNFLSKEGGNK